MQEKLLSSSEEGRGEVSSMKTSPSLQSCPETRGGSCSIGADLPRLKSHPEPQWSTRKILLSFPGVDNIRQRWLC